MNERLSNGATDLIKYVLFPLCCLAGVGSGISMAITVSPLYALVILAPVALIFLIGRVLFRCQHVVATDTGLRVGKPGHDVVEIKYGEIAAVRQFNLSNPKLISVDLKTSSPLGTTIHFLALMRVGFAWSVHPTTKFLRERAGLAAE